MAQKPKLKNEGTIAFRLQHPADGWVDDDKQYEFPDLTHGEITVSVTKLANKALRLKISGPLGGTTVFEHQAPPSSTELDTVHMAVSWKKPIINFFLNGVQVESVRGPRPRLKSQLH